MNRAVSLFLTWIIAFVTSIPIMFIAGCFGTSMFLMFHEQTLDAHNIPDRFPVVVITRGEPQRPNAELDSLDRLQRTLKSGDVATVVLFHELTAYTAQYDSYSYLIPENEVIELDAALHADPKTKEYLPSGITVKALPGGKEEITLEASTDIEDSNKGTYEASTKQVTPKSYHTHSEFIGFAGSIAGFYLCLPLSFISASFVTWRKSRKPEPPAAAAVAAGPPA